MPIKCDIEVPEKVVGTLGISRDKLGETLKKELSAYFFEKKILSFGQARQFAGLSVWDFMSFLKDRKIPLHYELSEYEDDSRTIGEIS